MVLNDKIAYITGGSKGIGFGIAESLIKQGMKVAITGRNGEAVTKAVSQLNAQGQSVAIGIVSDVRNAEDEKSTVEEVINKWGKLDVLIANAGLGRFGSIEDLTLKQWNEAIDTNLTGVFNSVKAAIPALKESKGYIITIGSLAGINFFAGGAAYNASKFGLVGFSQAIMLDLRQVGIKVTTIMPGSVTSNFNEHVPNDEDSWKIQPEDIGQMVVDLLKMNPRTLPSKIEVRPSKPPVK
ncbi:MAG: SDR family oxidoreductase [Bacteroidetes bacterium]|nr:SDR family oxidoreductase [Bacteroidota bacterium]